MLCCCPGRRGERVGGRGELEYLYIGSLDCESLREELYVSRELKSGNAG